MRLARTFCSVSVCLALASSSAMAAEPEIIPTRGRGHGAVVVPYCPPTQAQPQPPPAAQPAPPAVDAFAQAPAAGTDVPASYNPVMFGDFIGFGQHSSGRSSFSSTRTSSRPILSNNSFKIADNESPRPMDRAFFTYNYYNNVNGISDLGVHRELIGFERTVLDGDASIGLRLPFVQAGGASAFDDAQFGDLTIITKYALMNDRISGSVLSSGLAITVPTGESLAIAGQSDLHPWILQPYIGYIMNGENWYIHGFSSLGVPTDLRFTTLLANDIGVGYWLYRSQMNDDRLLGGIVPTIETHINTPLSHRGSTATPVATPDIVDLTGGVNFIFSQGSTLGVALATPLTGPRPFDVEAFFQFNLRF